MSDVRSRRRKGVVRLALERSVRSLAVGAEHAVLVESCRRLADEVDGMVVFDDRVFREFRLAVGVLMEATADGGSDAFEAALAELRSRSAVGDVEDPVA